MKKHHQNMLQGPVFLSILIYTVPIILTNILQLLFNAADLIVVGQFCSSTSVAAVGATSSITTLIVSFFGSLTAGCGVCVSHALGSRKETAIHRTVHTGLTITLLSGVVVSTVGLGFSKVFLQWMDTPENVLDLSALYMRIYFCGVIFNMVYGFCAGVLRAGGDTKTPLYFLVLSGIINVGLNILFVTAFHMDVAGVALATTISQGVSAILVVILLLRRTDACKLQPKKLKIYKAQLVKIIRFGLPTGIQSCLFHITTVIIQSSVNSFGDELVAGYSAACNIEAIINSVLSAFIISATNFAGQNAGAGQYRRIHRILGACLGCVALACAIICPLLYIFAPQLVSLYVPDSPTAIAHGVVRIMTVCPFFILGGLMQVTGGTLRGIGASLTSMVISLIGICGIRIGWVYTVFQIPEFHTPAGLYMAIPVAWLATLIMMLIAYLIVSRRTEKKHPSLV